MPDIVWLALALVVLGAITVFAFRLEPHWSSKDGRRFICRAQLLGADHMPIGRWREVRGEIVDDEIKIRSRSLLVRQAVGTWHVHAHGVVDKRDRRVYLLRKQDGDGEQLALRMPGNSNSVPMIEALLSE